MNREEENFAYKVRHVLNERLEKLPEHVCERLEAARTLAIKRKKKEAPFYVTVFSRIFAGHPGVSEGDVFRLNKLGLVLPVLVLFVGLGGIFHFEQQRQIREIADIDIAVLSDELPPSAYADNGFKAYAVDHHQSRTGV